MRARPLARKRCTVSRNCFRLIGLVTKASNPEVTIFCWSSGITDADTAITGDVSSARVGADLAQRLDAVDVGQLDVHQDQVGAMLVREADAFLAGRRLERRVAVVAQDVAHELHVLLVVLDDQDRAHWTTFRFMRSQHSAGLSTAAVGRRLRRTEPNAAVGNPCSLRCA